MDNKMFMDFDNYFTYENYFKFIEIYFKKQGILKKEVIIKTKINAGTYRSFLKKMNDKKYLFYEKISKAYDIYLPSKLDQKSYEEFCDKLFYNLYFFKNKDLEHSIMAIDNYLGSSVNSLFDIPLIVLRCFIIMFNSELSIRRKTVLLNDFLGEIDMYLSLLTPDLFIIYEGLKLYLDTLNNPKYQNYYGYIEKSKNSPLYGLILELFSKLLIDINDVSNSLIYLNKTRNYYWENSYYLKIVHIDFCIAKECLLANNYQLGYEKLAIILKQSDCYPKFICSGIQDYYYFSLILLEKYNLAYNYYLKKEKNYFNDTLIKTSFLFVCLKLNRLLEAERIFEEISEDIYSFTPYAIITESLVLKYNKKLKGTRLIQTKELIKSLDEHICKLLFNFYLNNLN